MSEDAWHMKPHGSGGTAVINGQAYFLAGLFWARVPASDMPLAVARHSGLSAAR